MTQGENDISAVPPDFPNNGHLKAVTGLPVLPYQSSGNPLRGDHLLQNLYAHTKYILSERLGAAKPPHQCVIFVYFIENKCICQ